MSDGYNFIVSFPGRDVDIFTCEGANAFLETMGGRTIDLELIVASRSRLASSALSSGAEAETEWELERAYLTVRCIACYADTSVFDAALKPVSSAPNRLLLYWLHAESVLRALTDDRQWKTTGQVKSYDLQLLVSLTSLCLHVSGCRLLLDQTTLLKTIATFFRSCEKPCGEVCRQLLDILCNLTTIMRKDMDKSLDEVFGLYEKTGVLEQGLRCIAYPETMGATTGFFEALAWFLDELMQAPMIVRKKLRPGTPTGDVLATLVKRNDIKKSIHNRLQNLSRLSSYTDKTRNIKLFRSCRHCGKRDTSEEFQASLKLCQRCKDVFYCNRECQTADWKRHKKVCNPDERKGNHIEKASTECMTSFISEHYPVVMTELANAMKLGNYQKEDAMLTLDFSADAHGLAPALQSPPVFSFVRVSELLNGGNVKPEWFHEDYSEGLKDPQMWRDEVKRISQTATDNDLLVTIHFSFGLTVAKGHFQAPDSRAEMFSNEAARAFSLLTHHDDFSGLQTYFGDEDYRWIRSIFRKIPCQRT